MSSFEISKIFKTTYFEEHLRKTAPVSFTSEFLWFFQNMRENLESSTPVKTAAYYLQGQTAHSHLKKQRVMANVT